MPSGTSLRFNVPVQVRSAASVLGGTSPEFAPGVAVGAFEEVAVAVGVGVAAGVPGPPLKKSSWAPTASAITTTSALPAMMLSRLRRFS